MKTTRFHAACTLFAALSACARGDAATRADIPIPVQVRVLDEEGTNAAQRYSGSVEPATRVDVAFKVAGHVRLLAEARDPDGRRRVLQDGDRVEKGAVLAVVKEDDYRVRLEAAKASLAEARASERQAELDHDRSAKLLASNSVSQAETDSMIVKLDVARARVAAAAAKVREAALALEDCNVRAPIGGVVLRRSVEVGTLAGAGSPAFSIAEVDRVKVVFGAPDRLVEKLTLGEPIDVEIPALGRGFAARISRISPSADRASRVFDVEATITNERGLLKPGMVASLSVAGSRVDTPSLALPLTAILRSPSDPRGFAVFVVEGDGEQGAARMRDVSLGEITGNRVFVQSGLERGDRVVSMGASLLAEGTNVRIIPSTER